MSFQSKRLRRSVESRRDAGRRDLGTRVQDSIVVSKYLSPKPERHMGRSLQRYISDGLRTLQRCNPQGAPRASFPASHPQTVCDSRILLQISTSQTEKTSPQTPASVKSKTNFCSRNGGVLWGSSGRVREAWRVVTDFATQNLVNSGFAALDSPYERGLPAPPRSFLPLHSQFFQPGAFDFVRGVLRKFIRDGDKTNNPLVGLNQPVYLFHRAGKL